MKRLLFLLSAAAIPLCTSAQGIVPQERPNSVALAAGMGVNLVADPGMVDYINTFSYSTGRASDFAAAVDFFGACEFPVSDEWGAKIEYAYLFNSYNFASNPAGVSTLFYDLTMPTVIAQYVIPGKGYFVKLGGGAGYHFGSVVTTDAVYGETSRYRAQGVGVKVEAAAQTAFGEHLYGYIAGDMRWEFLGTAKDQNGAALQNEGFAASLSLFSIGLIFGLTYYF
ncbi:MAG: hypothetical protein KGJ59_06605 [Bacteroidota bacterium]|nr:hypothetical protein [Bacteroidota bacterium]